MTEELTGTSPETDVTTEIADEILGTSPEPQEEPQKEEVKEEPKQERARSETVPHAALHEERERRKAVQQELQQLKEREKVAEDRLSKLHDAILANTQPREDVYIDPIEAQAAKIKELEEKLNTTLETAQKSNKQAAEEQQFISRYRQSVDAFTKDQPDFMEAYNFIQKSRSDELAAIGYDQNQIQSELVASEKHIVEMAYKQEKNPGEVIFNLAKSRGYKPSANKIEQLDKGLKASKSLGSGGGKSDSGLPDLASLGTMSNEEFDRVWKQFEKSSRR